LQVVGIDCHIGSQIVSLDPFREAVTRVLQLAAELQSAGFTLSLLDVGGGLGAPYADETPPDPAAYGTLLRTLTSGTPYRLIVEPGRVLVANAGILLTRVLLLKGALLAGDSGKKFAVVDAGMNDLIRPALYGAHHTIEADVVRQGAAEVVDVVGPVCESSDFFAKARALSPLAAGDLLLVRSTGAYGFSMASQYNSRPRAAEVLVDGKDARVIRERETLEDLWRGEKI
jgi:diaminopimelate decarboxylase